MQDISPLAWVFIIILVVVLVVLNVGLAAFLRYRPTLKMKIRSTQDMKNASRLLEVMKDPFGEERRQLNELSGLVDSLKKPAGEASSDEQEKD